MGKCVCGRELEHSKGLCYVCETLLLLSPEQQAEYLEIKRRCERVKNICSNKNRQQINNQD